MCQVAEKGAAIAEGGIAELLQRIQLEQQRAAGKVGRTTTGDEISDESGEDEEGPSPPSAPGRPL